MLINVFGGALMAICAKCGAEIFEGEEFCENCIKSDGNIENFDESYLDNLLNSINELQPSERQDIPKKKKTEGTQNIENQASFEDEVDLVFDYEDDNSSVEMRMGMDNLKDGDNGQDIEKLGIEGSDQLEETQDNVDIEDFGDMEDFDVSNSDEIDALEDIFNQDLAAQNEEEYNHDDVMALDQDLELDQPNDDKIDSDMDLDLDLDNILAVGHNMVQGEELDDMIGDMLDSLDNNGNIQDDDNQANDDTEESEGISNDDLMDLFSAMSSDEEQNDFSESNDEHMYEEEENQDIISIDDMFSSLNVDMSDEEFHHEPGVDIGDVFADSLGAVTSHQDSELDDAMMSLIPDKVEVKKEKVSLWQRLFGNIKDENPQQNKKAEKIADDLMSDSESIENVSSEDKKKSKKEKKEKTVKEKKEKKVKKTKEKKVKEIMQEVEDEDEGRINKVGAAIVFLFFGLFVAIIIIGTNIFSYGNSINQAEKYFNNKNYDKAYSEIAGTKIKEKDALLYKKIVTVMRVEKQVNSFENYYEMDEYPEALDSLLKGMKAYDESVDVATDLGIKKDMKIVYNQILDNLNETFDLTKEQAYEIINATTQEEYSAKVISAAKGNE